MIKRAFRGIQGRLVGFHLLLTLVALATSTYLIYQTIQGILLDSIQSHLRTIVDNKSQTILAWMKEREHDVRVLAKNAAVIEHLSRIVEGGAGAERSRGSLRSFLRLVRDQYGAYHEIVAIDRRGAILASTSGAATSPLRSPALLSDLRHGKSHISEVRRYRSDKGSLTLDVAAPIDAAGGTVVGAIVARVDLAVVNALTSSTALLRSGEAYLVNQRGQLITHRDSRRLFRDDISRVPAVKRVLSGVNGVGTYRSYRGIEVMGAYRWLPRWRWGLVAEIRRSEAFEPVYRARRGLLWIAGLVTIAMVLGTLLIARRIVSPLRDLAQAADAIAEGQLDQRLEISGYDEIDHLNGCFNRMAESLSTAQSAMDQRIREATRSLEEKNQQLEEVNDNLGQINRQLQQANRELERQRAIVAHSARLAAMGEMAAGIAHEINNPLTTIRNLLHTLSADLEPSDIHRRDLAVIEEETDKINRMVVNFLRYARPPKAKIAPVDCGALVERTLELLAPQISQKRLDVRSTLPETPPLQADAEQLGQVVLNLLLNAIQATPEGGTIDVALRTVHTDGGVERPTRVELSVTDRGPGIAEADVERVFKPFFTTKPAGSGLGLAISQRIIEEHGGQISFSNNADGVGVTFTVALDVREKRDEPDPDR